MIGFSHTYRWREIAAKMIEQRHVFLSSGDSDDDLHAADFIWTEGVLMWPRDQQMELVKVLREELATLNQPA